MDASRVKKINQGERELHVYVTVRGGVAYEAQVPDGVKLHILDFDNLAADRDTTLAGYSNEEQLFISRFDSGATFS